MKNSATQPTDDVILSASGISKSFPGVRALDDVSFTLRKGEVHALCGENGAGKSTLMKILAGVYQPDGGSIRFDGRDVALTDPLAAKQLGILLIHQELSLVPELSVAENIFLGSLPLKRFGRVDGAKLRADTRRALDRLGCDFGPDDIVSTLSIARQQLVEIARAVAFQSSIVIFDEPTASLTQQEADHLFQTIRRLSESGVTTVYISHKMREIFEISDRITVLRDGKVSGGLTTRQSNEDEVTRLMIGRDLDHYFIRAERQEGAELLRVEGLTSGPVRDISFNVHRGEVVGLYGLVGSGRTEIAETLFGIRPLESGTIHWEGEARTIRSPRDAIALGIGLVPEDRKHQGLVLGLGGSDNLALPNLGRVSRLGVIASGLEGLLFEDYRKRLSISTAGPKQPVLTLSGGNQQKIVIAKWLAVAPKLLILDEPTRGVDVGAKAEIHGLIAKLAESGLAVIVISSEMPEIIGVSHRILTIADGRLTSEIDESDFSEDRLIAAVTGHVWADETPRPQAA